VTEALVVIAAYLLGSIPFAFLAGRSRGIDLRTVGSGNLGAANVFRTLGREMGIAVMAADILKGVVAVVLARLLTDDPWPAVAAAAAMAGHVFPVWLRFKGGKGVAVAGGAVIALMPLAALILFGIWIAVVAITRYTSLASMIGCVAAAPVAWALGYPASTIVFAAAGAALVLFLHRGNVRRLLRGEENRIELGRRPRRPPAGLSDAP
jgi:glycerol-3-phosphate acyltransferase PlsY